MASCLICGRAGKILYQNLQDFIISSDAFWSLYICPIDQTAWISPTPSIEDLKKAYSFYHTHIAPSESSLLPKTIRDAVLAGFFGYTKSAPSEPRRRAGQILGKIPAIRELIGTKILWLHPKDGTSLLDVGCGNGAFLAFMRSLGWVVQGIEPDDKAAQCARMHYGLHVTTGFIEEAGLPQSSFDAVTVSHVLEHVGCPEVFLAACFRVLKPGGKLIINTPNLWSLGHQIFKRYWSILEPPRHLHIFSPRSLCACVEKAGFQTVHVFTTSHGARVMWDMSLMLRRIGSLGANTDKYRHPWRLGGILFYLAEQTLNIILRQRGEEAVLIAKKLGQGG